MKKPARFALRFWCTTILATQACVGLLAHTVDILPDAVAVAHVTPAQGQDVVGTVQFIPTADGVRVLGHLMNLSPGEHGLHIHERGDLSAPDLSSAGGHFNPTHEPHAGPDAARRHLGDLGNITVEADGTAFFDRVDRRLQLDGEHSIVHRALIVHAQPDDLKTQPSGNAGKRVAGGIIDWVRHDSPAETAPKP